MSKAKEAELLEWEQTRDELLKMLATANNAIALLKKQVGYVPRETTFHLKAMPTNIKGTKPSAVFFGEEQVLVKTWRGAYTEILNRCAADKHDALMYLRGRISGRKRFVLSGKPDDMNKPIQLADDLFAETFFDTEWLLKMLLQILDAAGFDYSGISIAVSWTGRGSGAKTAQTQKSQGGGNDGISE